MQQKLNEAARFIENAISSLGIGKPKVGVVLGSGLGEFTKKLKNAKVLRFDEIPHFLPTTVDGHQGQLVIGTIGGSNGAPGVPVAVLSGRLHFYEGHSMEEVVFPVRTLCLLGIETIVLTNASGGINPSFREGDLMLVTDHINLMGSNPLLGPNLKNFGPRFPDLTEAYDPTCLDVLRKVARELGASLGSELKEGVYVSLTGPTYETPAEVRMLRVMGADAVGMSTVPEVIAANHFGIRVAAVSCIANLAAGITPRKLSHAEVVTNAAKAASKLITLLETAIPKLPQ